MSCNTIYTFGQEVYLIGTYLGCYGQFSSQIMRLILHLLMFTAADGVLKAGHVIISVTADGVTTYKPMPVSGSSYGSLPASHSYVGVLKASIPVKDPRAAIVTMGQVNAAASPYPLTSAMKNALSNIQFMY